MGSHSASRNLGNNTVNLASALGSDDLGNLDVSNAVFVAVVSTLRSAFVLALFRTLVLVAVLFIVIGVSFLEYFYAARVAAYNVSLREREKSRTLTAMG